MGLRAPRISPRIPIGTLRDGSPMLLPLVLSVLASGSPHADVVLRPFVPSMQVAAPAPAAGEAEAGCDDGSSGGTLVERLEAYYGNRFTAPCAAAVLEGASFVHFGYGLAGPYAYRLHLLDAQCREIGVTDVQNLPAAGEAPGGGGVGVFVCGVGGGGRPHP